MPSRFPFNSAKGKDSQGNNYNFQIIQKLGNGSFGDVYLANNLDDVTSKTICAQCAIKVENRKTPNPQLQYEGRLLKYLYENAIHGISKVYFDNACIVDQTNPATTYSILCMEILGPSLEDLVEKAGGTFKVKTVLLIIQQLLDRIQGVHECGFLHRDIKPENFLVGRNEQQNTVYIIDFGLSKKYIPNKEHIPYKDNKSLTGTARYASINAHRGIEQSRRDDLEAIGHMIIYFLIGELPWQGLPAQTKEEKYTKIKNKKISTDINHLCKDISCPEFRDYLDYARKLQFTERPNYDSLRDMFEVRFISMGFDREARHFQWMDSKAKDKYGHGGDDVVAIEKSKNADQVRDGKSPNGKKTSKLCGGCGGGKDDN